MKRSRSEGGDPPRSKWNGGLSEPSAEELPPPTARPGKEPSRELAFREFPDETAGVEDLDAPPDVMHRRLRFVGGPRDEWVELPPAVLVAAGRDHADALGVVVGGAAVFVETLDGDDGAAEGVGAVVCDLPDDSAHAFACVAVAAYENVHCPGLCGFGVALFVVTDATFMA